VQIDSTKEAYQELATITRC